MELSDEAVRVVGAFGAGWHMAELYHYDRIPGEGDKADDERLPGLGRLSAAQRARVIDGQIRTGLAAAGSAAPDDLVMSDRPSARRIDAAVLKERVAAAHIKTLIELSARAPLLGRSYNLGRGLAETFLVPDTSTPATFRTQLAEHRLGTLLADLRDLRGQFPAGAAEIVGMSLAHWQAWAERIPADATWETARKQTIGQHLRIQGTTCYSLLMGDSDPHRLLHTSDYIVAAEQLLLAIRRLAHTFIAGNRSIQALLGAAAMLGLLLLVAAITNRLGFVVGVTVLFAGVLGTSLATIASAVRRAVNQVTVPLWNGELTLAMAAACTHLPPD